MSTAAHWGSAYNGSAHKPQITTAPALGSGSDLAPSAEAHVTQYRLFAAEYHLTRQGLVDLGQAFGGPVSSQNTPNMGGLEPGLNGIGLLGPWTTSSEPDVGVAWIHESKPSIAAPSKTTSGAISSQIAAQRGPLTTTDEGRPGRHLLEWDHDTQSSLILPERTTNAGFSPTDTPRPGNRQGTIQSDVSGPAQNLDPVLNNFGIIPKPQTTAKAAQGEQPRQTANPIDVINATGNGQPGAVPNTNQGASSGITPNLNGLGFIPQQEVSSQQSGARSSQQTGQLSHPGERQSRTRGSDLSQNTGQPDNGNEGESQGLGSSITPNFNGLGFIPQQPGPSQGSGTRSSQQTGQLLSPNEGQSQTQGSDPSQNTGQSDNSNEGQGESQGLDSSITPNFNGLGFVPQQPGSSQGSGAESSEQTGQQSNANEGEVGGQGSDRTQNTGPTDNANGGQVETQGSGSPQNTGQTGNANQDQGNTQGSGSPQNTGQPGNANQGQGTTQGPGSPQSTEQSGNANAGQDGTQGSGSSQNTQQSSSSDPGQADEQGTGSTSHTDQSESANEGNGIFEPFRPSQNTEQPSASNQGGAGTQSTSSLQAPNQFSGSDQGQGESQGTGSSQDVQQPDNLNQAQNEGQETGASQNTQQSTSSDQGQGGTQGGGSSQQNAEQPNGLNVAQNIGPASSLPQNTQQSTTTTEGQNGAQDAGNNANSQQASISQTPTQGATPGSSSSGNNGEEVEPFPSQAPTQSPAPNLNPNLNFFGAGQPDVVTAGSTNDGISGVGAESGQNQGPQQSPAPNLNPILNFFGGGQPKGTTQEPQQSPTPNLKPNLNFFGGGQPQETPSLLPGSSTSGKPIDPGLAANGQGVAVEGKTIIENGPSITVSGKAVVISSGIIQVGSDRAPVPIITPQAQGAPNAQPVVVGGLSFNPVPASNGQATKPMIEVQGQTLTDNGPAIQVSGQDVRLSSGILHVATSAVPILRPQVQAPSPVVVGGLTFSPVPKAAEALTTSPLVIAGQTVEHSNGEFRIGSQTLKPGASAIDVAGTPVSLGSSSLVVGSSTLSRPDIVQPLPNPVIGSVGTIPAQAMGAGVQIGSRTLTPGVAATISGTPVSLGSSNDLVIGDSSTTFARPGPSLNPPIATIANTPVQAVDSGIRIGSSILTPGGVATISDTPVSLGDSNNLVIGSSTLTFSPAPIITSSDQPPPIATIAAQPIRALPSDSGVRIGTTILTPGAAATISGTPVSLGNSNDLVIGSSTLTFTPPTAPPSDILTTAPTTPTPLAISEGGPERTVAGVEVSLESQGLIVGGSSTVPIPSSVGGAVITIGGTILSAGPSGLVFGGAYRSSESSSSGTSTQPATTPAARSTSVAGGRLLVSWGLVGAGAFSLMIMMVA